MFLAAVCIDSCCLFVFWGGGGGGGGGVELLLYKLVHHKTLSVQNHNNVHTLL